MITKLDIVPASIANPENIPSKVHSYGCYKYELAIQWPNCSPAAYPAT